MNRQDGTSIGQRFPFTTPTPGAAANQTLNYAQFEPITFSPGYSPKNRLPYAEHVQLLHPARTLEIDGAHARLRRTEGHRLISQYDANPGSPADLSAAQCRRRDAHLRSQRREPDLYASKWTQVFGTRTALGPAFGGYNTITANIANSNYNSAQITVERKAADMTFLAAYTFSKAIDNASGFGDLVNFSNYRLSRALSAYDVTHNFVASYSWALPFERAFRNLPRRLTEGWNVNGITRFATGFPVNLSQSGDVSLYNTEGVDVPNLVGPVKTQDPRKPGPNGPNTYFLPSAFTSGPVGAFGNANRRFFHGPGIINTDFGMTKRIRITESLAAEVRGEFFNIFNHTQFNNPNGNYTSSLFGVVTSARDPRIGQVSAKFFW